MSSTKPNAKPDKKPNTKPLAQSLKPVQLDGSKDTLAPGLSRRSFFIAAGAVGVGSAAGSLLGTSEAKAQSTDWTQPGNNNHVIALQNAKSFKQGSISIDYFGHCAMRITSPGGASVLIDPWRDDPSGAWGFWFKSKFPETKTDITLSTHTHFDHDAVDRPVSTMVLDRMVGTFEFADLKISGYADKHVCRAVGKVQWTNVLKEFGVQACPPNNANHMDNVTYVIETGGIRTLIWGDNRPNPSPGFWKAIGKVDVVTLPVDGSEHILSMDQGNTIVEKLGAKIIIPTHYLGEATTYTTSTLEPATKWVKSQKSFKMLGSAKLRLRAKDVAKMNKEFMYFGNNVLKA